MLRSSRRRVLWVGNRALYDTVTDAALRARLEERGWIVEAAEGIGTAYHRSLAAFTMIHCWDLSAVGEWLPVLRMAQKAGQATVLSPVYDGEYFARSQQSMLGNRRSGPFPDAVFAWRFTRTQQRFALAQTQMLLLTSGAEGDAIHQAFPNASCIPSTIVPACIANNPTQAATLPEAFGDRPYVLCVAPISPVVGQADIIRSVLKTGLTPVLVGTATLEHAEYEKECRSLTAETIWLPSLPSQQLVTAVRQARLVIHPARDVIVPLLGAQLGVPVIVPATHYAREYINGRVLPYRRSDPESLDTALREALSDITPPTPTDPASSLDAAVIALATTYDTIAAGESRRDVSRGDDAYAQFLETELIREYRTNQMPHTVIATLEAQVAWYRRIAEDGALRSELRRSERAVEEMHALAHARFVHIGEIEAIRAMEQEAAHRRARQQEERIAALTDEVMWRQRAMEGLTAELAWRQRAMEGLTAELAHYRRHVETRVRAWISRARRRLPLRPDA